MFKNVLTHLSGTDCDQSVLATALRIAAADNAHIEALRLIPDPSELIAEAAQIDMGGWMIISDTVTAIEKEAAERTKAAQSNLAAFCASEKIPSVSEPGPAAGVSISWREEAGDEFDRITSLGRYHDLIVLGGGADRPGRLPEEALGGIIIGSGRPVVLAPETAGHGPFNKIAIAWKDSPESARAVTAAMPLLEKARDIEVFSINETDRHAAECVECSDSIVRCLRWHGLNAHGHFVIPAGRTPADAALGAAREAGADLLVMGAYGHSRMREFVFGGFTQRMLRGAPLPVLLFH